MSNEINPVFYKPFSSVSLSKLASLASLALIASLLTSCSSESPDNADDSVTQEIDQITAPVAQVEIAGEAGSSAATAAADVPIGQATYDEVCFACHATGLAGAPKYAEEAAWTARIDQGLDTLYDHAINGYVGPSGAMMPAKGGNASLSDDAVKAAVDYMVVGAGGTVPTAATAPAETTTETAASPAMSDNGKATYDEVCFTCHATGLAGAPIFADKAVWADRIAQGKDVLYDHAINGYVGASGSMMPAKGGRADIADDKIEAAVDYMIEAVGGYGDATAPDADAAAPATETPAAEAPVAAAADNSAKGKEIYDASCFACHAMGIAGAPKFGDPEVWKDRIAKGKETLYDHAINGFMGEGLMPPKGGAMTLSDDDVKAAVDYMVSNSQ